MVLIREVVQQALTTGYLSVAAENQLRQLLKSKYDREDLDAFMTLQQAAMAGVVRQESRELKYSHNLSASRRSPDTGGYQQLDCSPHPLGRIQH